MICQHRELEEFNPGSVNTLRIVTIRSNRGVKIMDAVLRIGNGNGVTDNFHQHGLAMKVDQETGRVISAAVDKSNRYYRDHPISGKTMVGFQVPSWEEVLQTVRSAAILTKEARYIGWDLAILSDGKVAIIEGNCASDPDITQIPTQVGRWPQYRKVLGRL